MKYLITLSLLFIYLNLQAQDSPKPIKTTSEITSIKAETIPKQDTSRVIYDENGKALRYYQYSKLIYSGAYVIHYDGNPSAPTTKAFLKKISKEELLKRDEIIKKFFRINNSFISEGKILDITPLTPFYKKEKLENKAIVLIFWYADCPPCTENFADINSFLKEMDSSKDLSVVAITTDDQKVAESKLKEKPLLYAEFINSGRAIANAYQIKSYPSYIITDKNHVIRLATAGSSPITMTELKEALKVALGK